MYPASLGLLLPLQYWKVLMVKFNLPLSQGSPFYYMTPWSHGYAIQKYHPKGLNF
jgi:hypothetical protein